MIIGDGDIASTIKDDERFLYFASGVSDSMCKDEKQFDRESGLLTRAIESIESSLPLTLVYFSTLSIYFKSSPYTDHKKRMEAIVRTHLNHCIIRLGNITWGDNPHTLINTLRRYVNGEYCVIQNVERYLCSKHELLFWIDTLKEYDSKEINITGEKIMVSAIVERIRDGEL